MKIECVSRERRHHGFIRKSGFVLIGVLKCYFLINCNGVSKGVCQKGHRQDLTDISWAKAVLAEGSRYRDLSLTVWLALLRFEVHLNSCLFLNLVKIVQSAFDLIAQYSRSRSGYQISSMDAGAVWSSFSCTVIVGQAAYHLWMLVESIISFLMYNYDESGRIFRYHLWMLAESVIFFISYSHSGPGCIYKHQSQDLQYHKITRHSVLNGTKILLLNLCCINYY